MKDKCCESPKVKRLHPMDDFGITKISLNAIRIDRLEDRVVPRVPFPHKHAFYQFIIFTQGAGNHQIDFKDFKVVKNHLFLLKPGQIHNWKLKNAKGYVVEFNQDSFSTKSQDFPDLIHHIHFTPDSFVQKNQDDFQRLRTVCELMYRESRLEGELFDVSLKGYLTGFLIEIIRQTETIKGNLSKTHLIERFNNLVEANYKTQHRVEFYAQELKLSPKAFTMQLTRILGKSPRDVIQERILLEAKRYLAYSNLSIAEIGYELGFDDANYFSRFYRLHEKTTPAKFRSSATTA